MTSRLWLLILWAAPLWAQSNPLNTIHIKGTVTLKEEVFTLNGDFTYTLQNHGSLSQSKWVLISNPLVNILSVRYNDRDVEVLSQQYGGYRILTVTLPSPLKPGERTSLAIRFSLLPQADDSRFSLGSHGSFLDARRLWFPLPDGDLNSSYEINVETPSNLRAIMGGRLVMETSGLTGNFSRWESELNNITLSGLLIITDKARHKQGDIYLYGDDQNAHLQAFLPYWKAIREKNPQFPLTELHLFPIDISIPGKGDDFADGEFIGNAILMDNKLVQAAQQNPEGDFAWAGNAQKRLTETLIHELFHTYFPGILSYKAEEAIVIEGLIQYLALSLISDQNKAWAEDIARRNRFLKLNFLCARDTQNPLWKYLISTALFDAAFEQSSLRGLALANTLAEKYRYTQFGLNDIIETAEIHQNLVNDDKISPEFLGEFQRTFLYNTALQVFSTNLTRVTSIIRVRHTFSKDWAGTLTWINSGRAPITNTLELSIPAGKTWITNLPGEIIYAALKSNTDNLEQYLGDNVFSPNDYGRLLTAALNSGAFFNQDYRLAQHIDVPPQVLETLQRYRELNMAYLWDNSKDNEVQAYIVDSRNVRQAFVSLMITQKNGGYELTRVVNPLEKRIDSRLKPVQP